jgi:hypothetical protein
MSKPVLVVTARFVDEVEARIDREFEARRKPKSARFTAEELLSAADGADAMIVTPADRLDAAFFIRVASSIIRSLACDFRFGCQTAFFLERLRLA